MRKAIKALRIIAGATLFAIAIFVIVAAPGFLSNSSSTVAIGNVVGTGR